MQKFIIKTTKTKEIVDLTQIVNDLLMKNSYYEGIGFLFVMHTTCSLATVDLDPGVTDEDFIAGYEALAPKLSYKHPHNPGHFYEHLLATTVGSSVFVPVQSSNMVLGLNQRLALIEFSGPKERRIVLSFFKQEEKSSF